MAHLLDGVIYYTCAKPPWFGFTDTVLVKSHKKAPLQGWKPSKHKKPGVTQSQQRALIKGPRWPQQNKE